MAEERPVRPCVLCPGAMDDHPRHQVDVPQMGSVYFHMDCHAATGCEVCQNQIAGVPEGTIGMELVRHLTTKDEVTDGRDG